MRRGIALESNTARAVYHLTKATLTRRQPIYVIYEVTDRCNLKCKMCSIWRRANRAEELNLDQIEVLASRLRDIGVVVVSLSGGEPFMREDLPEIARIFKRKGLITRLMTNAADVDEARIRAVIDAGIDSVSISLNTLFPEDEAYICRADHGLWERVVSNMLLFSNVMRQRGTLLVMSACVSSLNVDQLPLLEEFAAFLGFRANFMPTELAAHRDPGLRFSDFAPELGLAIPDRMQFLKSMNTLLKRKRRGVILNSTRFLHEMKDFVLHNGYHSGICDAGTLYF
ncbi:radical SAM protein, partial [bacterium]|nr:radical SAM protein [bacterium]